MLCARLHRIACVAVAIVAIWQVQEVRGQGEIVFVDLDDLPIDAQVVLSSPPFSAAFLPGPPCEDVPPGTWGPPCIAIYDGLFASMDNSAVRLEAGATIGTGRTYATDVVLAGFELLNPSADPNDWQWRPIANDWYDPSGAPVRGYLGWSGVSDDGAVHYGWVDVTVTYDLVAEEFTAVLHGLAYETTPGRPIAAGDIGDFCFGDLDGDRRIGLGDLSFLLANYGVTSGMGYYDGNLDADGDVDLGDLSRLLSVYGTSCD